MLKQSTGWTIGLLANQIWSFAGKRERRSVNTAFLQPFLAYTTKMQTAFGVNTESTYDWNNSQWTAPINFTVAQLLKVGKMPVQFTLVAKVYAEGASGAPEWGLRLVITPLFPTGSRARRPDTLHPVND